MVPKILLIVGFLLFVASFFLPVISINDDIQFTGTYVFGIAAGLLFYVQSASEYFEYIFGILANVWALLLFFRFWRRGEKRVLTYVITLLALGSTCYWYFRMEDPSIFMIGFWMWAAGISLIAIANLIKKRAA